MPSKRIQVTVALPDLDTNSRVCFYGYEISREWLIDYSNKHWKGIQHFDDSAKVSTAIYLLRAHSGIKRLEYESALPDPKTAAGTVAMEGHPDSVVPLLSIFSNEVSSFSRRPSQEKVDRLSEILGGKQPKWWWVDYDNPRSYYEF